MASRTNLQFQVNKEFADEFMEVVNDEPVSSKIEFLKKIFYEYVNPDQDEKTRKVIEDLQKQLEEKQNEVQLLSDDADNKIFAIEELKGNYSFFESKLNPILNKYKGDKVSIKDAKTKKTAEIEVNSIEDVFEVILKSIKISK